MGMGRAAEGTVVAGCKQGAALQGTCERADSKYSVVRKVRSPTWVAEEEMGMAAEGTVVAGCKQGTRPIGRASKAQRCGAPVRGRLGIFNCRKEEAPPWRSWWWWWEGGWWAGRGRGRGRWQGDMLGCPR